MDAILNVGLEMGSHNQDCWTHVFRYMNTLTHTQVYDVVLHLAVKCYNDANLTSPPPRVSEYISSLEHAHFSDGSSLPPPSSLTTFSQQRVDVALDLSTGDESSPEVLDLNLSHPVLQPVSVHQLLRDSATSGRHLDLRAGSLMSGSAASKAVCTLSTQADR